MSVQIDDIKNFFEKSFSDISRQYDWDNSGAQILSGRKDVRKVGFALDPTEEIIDQAVNEGCELLITHHPLFFTPFQKIDTLSRIGRIVSKALKADISILSYHTSLDMADYSLNDYIADLLGGNVEGYLDYFKSENYQKFVVFVPKGFEDSIINAIDEAGGGCIGNYSKCTFYTEGTGTFLPGDNTDPFIGEKGKLEKAEEVRLETIVSAKNINKVVESVNIAHPYEEMAYDIYPLALEEKKGLGRICTFRESVSFKDFVETIYELLALKVIKHNAQNTQFEFSKFAVVTGSGSSLWKKCKSAGVDVLVTGDMKHHDALDARAEGIVIVDCGHFESERIYMEYLAKLVKDKFDIDTTILKETPSIKYFWG